MEHYTESIYPGVKVWMTGSQPFFGPGQARLLEEIDRTGSLQQACAQMGMSYSKGSRLMKTMEKELGMILVERHSGGFGGGGAALTEDGRAFLSRYRQMVKEVKDSTEQIFSKYFADGCAAIRGGSGQEAIGENKEATGGNKA